MGLKSRKRTDTNFYFYGGKGGVGKTSVASSAAIYFSQKLKKKVLVVSIDPAHSLSDSFDVRIGSEVRQVMDNLYALEIDPAKSLEEYKEKLVPSLEKIEFLKGIGLEDAFDVTSMAPGVDEIAAFDKFLKFMNSEEYDVIIFDTAPTGHALRFLSFPEVMDSWVGKMIKIRMRLSGMTGMLKKLLPFGGENEAPSLGTEQLEEMKKRIEEARKILSNPKKTHYNLVMIPEQMSIMESERSVKLLKEYKIPVKSIIINKILPSNPSCTFCTYKRKQQLDRIKDIEKKFRSYKISRLEMFRDEVRGIDMLKKVAGALFG